MLIRRVAGRLSRQLVLQISITSAHRNNTRGVIERLLDESFNHLALTLRQHFNFKSAPDTHASSKFS